MWPFDTQRRKARKLREEDQQQKIASSQRALLDAATSTADAAQHVTARLKQRLEDSLRQFETTAAMLSDALLICDEKGRIQAVNPAAETIFAASATLMMGMTVADLFRKGSRSRFADAAEVWASFADDSIEVLGWRKSGERFPVGVTMTRLDRSDGTTLILCLVRDMSAHVDTRRAAEVHEHRYRTLFDLSFDGVLVVQEERIVAANPAAGRIFGRDASSLLCASLTSVLKADEDRRVVEAMADGEGSPDQIEVESVATDGRAMSLLLGSAAITWNGAPASLVTVRDITEARQNATDRRDNGVDMICVFGNDLCISFANEAFARYYGVPRDSLRGTDIRTLLPEEERDAFLLNLQGLTPTNPTRRMHLHAPHRGSIRLQDWIDHGVFDDRGRTVEYQRTGRDITDALSSLLTGNKPSS